MIKKWYQHQPNSVSRIIFKIKINFNLVAICKRKKNNLNNVPYPTQCPALLELKFHLLHAFLQQTIINVPTRPLITLYVTLSLTRKTLKLILEHVLVEFFLMISFYKAASHPFVITLYMI